MNWCAGPEKTLRSDDALAITTPNATITYNNFNSRIRHLANEMHHAGIRDKHRVLIVGDNVDIIESICWTWAAIYLGASPGNASTVESADDIMLKAGAGNCDAIISTNGNIELKIGYAEDKGGKVHEDEKYILFSSGTTKKLTNKFGVEPQFFTYPKDWTGGIAHIDQIKLAYKFLGEVPVNELACHGWEVAYAPHNVVQCLLTGGTYHWVPQPEMISEAQAEYKTNLISNYPLSYDPILSAWGDNIPPIEVVDVAGGICTPDLIDRIRLTINPRIITNSFISSASGTILNRIIDAKDDPDLCSWLENPHIDSSLRLRMDDSNVLWFKRGDSDWITDGDLFKQEGKYYKVVGKASDEFITTRNGRISTWEVEQFANQLTRTVWGCGEHTYVFPMNGLNRSNGHGLVYSGPLAITLMKERMAKMAVYKRPDIIYQVKPEFWSLNIKISRDHMSDRLENNPEYIENKL